MFRKGKNISVLCLPILLKKRGTTSTEVHVLPALRFLPTMAPIEELVALIGLPRNTAAGREYL